MLECLILGDSIAVGVSQVRKECVAYVQGGITSQGFINKYGFTFQQAKTVIISLGANDYYLKTELYIEKLRSNTKADRVFWLLPRYDRVPKAVEAVKIVASRYGDVVIERPKSVSADGIHPTHEGYEELALKTK